MGRLHVVGLLLLFVGTRYAKAWERAHGEDDAPARPLTPEARVPAGGVEEPASPRSPDL